MAVYCLSAILMLGYGSIFSLLAEIRDSFNLSVSGVGFIGAAAFISGFVAQLGFSRYADLGRGSAMLKFGVLICIIAASCMVVADSLWEWLISRGMLGFGAGVIRPAIRRLIVIANPEHLGRALGVLAAYETAGFLLGPAFAAFINTWLGLSETFIVLTVLLVFVFPWVIAVHIPAADEPPHRTIVFQLIKMPVMQSCLAMGAAFWITVGVFEGIWAVFLADLGASQIFIGLSMTVFGLPMIVVAPKAGALAQQYGPLTIAIVSIGVAIVCMVSYGFINHLWLLCIPLCIHSMMDAFSSPATYVAAAQASGENALASGQGLLGATGMLVAALAASVGGWLYDQAGAPLLWCLSALLMVVLMAFAWWRGEALRKASV